MIDIEKEYQKMQEENERYKKAYIARFEKQQELIQSKDFSKVVQKLRKIKQFSQHYAEDICNEYLLIAKHKISLVGVAIRIKPRLQNKIHFFIQNNCLSKKESFDGWHFRLKKHKVYLSILERLLKIQNKHKVSESKLLKDIEWYEKNGRKRRSNRC